MRFVAARRDRYEFDEEESDEEEDEDDGESVKHKDYKHLDPIFVGKDFQGDSQDIRWAIVVRNFVRTYAPVPSLYRTL